MQAKTGESTKFPWVGELGVAGGGQSSQRSNFAPLLPVLKVIYQRGPSGLHSKSSVKL